MVGDPGSALAKHPRSPSVDASGSPRPRRGQPLSGKGLGKPKRLGGFKVKRRPLVRALLASAALAAAIALAGCDTDSTTTAVNGRHMQPLSDRMLAEIGRASLGKECRSRWSPYH